MTHSGRAGERGQRRALRRAVRLWRLPSADKFATLRALRTLVVVEVLIRWVRLPRLARLVGVTLEAASRPDQAHADGRPVAPAAGPETARAGDREALVRAVRATRRVLRRWPFGQGPCLRESLVLGHLLRDRGPLLKIGVARKGERLLAHAWLEVDGQVLGDSQGFTTLGRPGRSTHTSPPPRTSEPSRSRPPFELGVPSEAAEPAESSQSDQPGDPGQSVPFPAA